MHGDNIAPDMRTASPPPPSPVSVAVVAAAAAAAVLQPGLSDNIHVHPLPSLGTNTLIPAPASTAVAMRSLSEKRSPRPATATFADDTLLEIPPADDAQLAVLHSAHTSLGGQPGPISPPEMAGEIQTSSSTFSYASSPALDAASMLSKSPASTLQGLPDPQGLPPQSQSQPQPQPQPQQVPSYSTYDWNAFITAYAAGRWNPHRIPSAPRPSAASTPPTPSLMSLGASYAGKKSASSSSTPVPLPPSRPSQPRGPSTETESSTPTSDLSSWSRGSSSSASSSAYSALAPQPVAPATTILPPAPGIAHPPPQLSASVPTEISPFSGLSQRRASVGSASPNNNIMRIPLPPPPVSHPLPLHRGALFSPSPHQVGPFLPPLLPALASPAISEGQSVYHSALSSGATTPDLATAAATMRWAASSHASLSPLALPSPEHELTDPMRGVTVALPVDDVEGPEEETNPDNGNEARQRAGYSLRKGSMGGRRGRYVIKNRSGGGATSASRRIWERFTSGDRHHSFTEETDVPRSDDDPTLHLPLESQQMYRLGTRGSEMGSFLSTIEASPLNSPSIEQPSPRQGSNGSGSGSGSASRSGEEHRVGLGLRSSSMPAPTSAPILRTSSDDASKPTGEPKSPVDYFGLVVRHRDTPLMASLHEQDDTRSGSAGLVASEDVPPTPFEIVSEVGETGVSSQNIKFVHPNGALASSQEGHMPASLYTSLAVPLVSSSGSVHAQSLPNTPMHRSVLSRQSSSPLPARTDPIEDESGDDDSCAAPESPAATPDRRTSGQLPNLRVGVSVSTGGKSSGASRPGLLRAQSMKTISSGHGPQRVSKEEEEYIARGYLVPPHPRDEGERRRALCKFNIVHTMPDVNFDRIAYLTKLVFSTKIVVVSLVDEDEEWFKMESGMGIHSLPRDESFCGHAVLQRGDEPTVVLDATRDWRFRNNPLVTGSFGVRFFAAAPLRTSDGFNVGALCIMDDHPHSEFTPRQRHTLKEFAAIVMREMELWRDKIQLRIRDRIQTSMEQFTRECLEIDNEAEAVGAGAHAQSLLKTSSMDRVYERAARLVKRTLDVEGAVVMDVSHFDVLETTKAEGALSIVCHHSECAPISGDNGTSEPHGTSTPTPTTHSVPPDEYPLLMEFFLKYPEGRVAEGIVPRCFRAILPTRIQHALIVPIFNIDKRPFALLCAYNTADHVKPFLEGHELSYLRAIGVIILSAVLKRRMILADKSKSLFISNISHELRTPLHGILAAAELLADSELDDNQASFLRTVQACGTSLVETVNHVLDFTKLSGNSKSGGVENVIHPSKIDLMQLVEEAVEGCWIGHRARLPASSEIGSVYAPPVQVSATLGFARATVETVIDVGLRNSGWQLICEKGGIRRVLMNIIGNSLKFTTSGYVHIVLKELHAGADTPPGNVKVELTVLDTGKGISKEFLKNQLFHPFSQENPLQSGTGLGLAIVNSIIHSDSVNGQVEVSSTEGVGTEIRITFNAAVPEDDQLSEIEKLELPGKQPTVSMIGFDEKSKGTTLLREVIERYLTAWWSFDIVPVVDGAPGDILVLNEDGSLISQAIEEKDFSRPFVLLTSSRADAETMAIVYEYDRLGGFCRVVSKPVGPSRLRQVLKACVHMIYFRDNPQHSPPETTSPGASRSNTLPSVSFQSDSAAGQSSTATVLPRRLSQEGSTQMLSSARPRLLPRANTYSTMPPRTGNSPLSSPPQEYPSSPGETTITIGAGGTLLKSSIGTCDRRGRARVLVVEDNQILRDLLLRWLGNKGYDFLDAIDGREGVTAFEKADRIDVILVDLSMPVLDGIAATGEIREIEAKRVKTYEQSPTGSQPPRPAKILALTGMSSLEDKRRAFEAGVDGYLVKPVAFKTLDAMFQQLGVS
ncbi:hypothetical protein M0805_001623 [Coniferiporia weirii]|nr:hypothetical protein M0805_001623 [Coniferiporia weirii]